MTRTKARTTTATEESASSSHDELFKFVFSRPRLAAAELRLVLPPELSARLGWRALRRLPGSFVDERLKTRHSDLLFSVPFDGKEALLCLLFEHQSRGDPLMPFRMLRYMVQAWDAFLVEHPGAKRLPAIIPVVLHHGRSGWSAPLDLLSIIDLDGPALVGASSIVVGDLNRPEVAGARVDGAERDVGGAARPVGPRDGVAAARERSDHRVGRSGGATAVADVDGRAEAAAGGVEGLQEDAGRRIALADDTAKPAELDATTCGPEPRRRSTVKRGPASGEPVGGTRTASRMRQSAMQAPGVVVGGVALASGALAEVPSSHSSSTGSRMASPQKRETGAAGAASAGEESVTGAGGASEKAESGGCARASRAASAWTRGDASARWVRPPLPGEESGRLRASSPEAAAGMSRAVVRGLGGAGNGEQDAGT